MPPYRDNLQPIPHRSVSTIAPEKANPESEKQSGGERTLMAININKRHWVRLF
ncbi:MAG: hypothetical protein AB4290_31305 [Spirulina sp.]